MPAHFVAESFVRACHYTVSPTKKKHQLLGIYLYQVSRALPVAWTATAVLGITMPHNALTASRAATARAVAARGSCRSAVRQREDETGGRRLHGRRVARTGAMVHVMTDTGPAAYGGHAVP